MKMWLGYGTEHSANLVIVGTFESAEKARKVESLIKALTSVARRDEEQGEPRDPTRPYSDEMFALLKENEFFGLGDGDTKQLAYDYGLKQDGDRLIVTTEESSFQVFINAMLWKEAKVEVYSAHAHPSAYMR